MTNRRNERGRPVCTPDGPDEISPAPRNLTAHDTAPESYLDPADKLMLAALRDGTYVLAVVCRVCGGPLTSKRSRARGVGPVCRRRIGGDE